MKKDKLKEYYGTQRPSFAGGPGAGSNFYSGRDLGTHSRGSLGTRGADSNFSRRMQALVPNDYYDLLEEEEDETIDEDVVVENSRYSLEKVLLFNEGAGDVLGAIGDAAVDIAGDAAAAAISTGEAGIPISSTLFIIKNIYEIKKGREKADEIVRHFLNNPSDDAVESMTDILDDLVGDVVDLVQRSVEAIPDPTPAEEFSTFAGSILLNLGKVLKVLKSGFGAVGASQRITRRMALYGIINPLIKYVIELFDSEYVPEKVAENKSIIMGTLQRMVLLADLVEDYTIQKEVAMSVGIPEKDFRYRHRIITSPAEVDSYDFENPRSARPIEERLEQEREEVREAIEEVENENSEDNLMPDESSSVTSASSASLLDTPLGRMFIKPRGSSDPSMKDVYQDIQSRLFAESLENKSLLYLIEEKDSDLEEEDEEVNEMSAGGVAGVAVPLGRNPDGSKTTKHQIKKQYDFFNKTYGRR